MEGRARFLSETLSGEPVGLRPVEAGRYDVWYGPIRLAGIDHRGRLTRHDPSPPTPPKPVDLMDNASALPTTPQAQQPQSQT